MQLEKLSTDSYEFFYERRNVPLETNRSIMTLIRIKIWIQEFFDGIFATARHCQCKNFAVLAALAEVCRLRVDSKLCNCRFTLTCIL